jgi:mRNA interferase RelE/StbE
VFGELLTTNPFLLGYLERMAVYPDKYKIRIGSYRIGITIDKQNNLIICQHIAHRKDIYSTEYSHKLIQKKTEGQSEKLVPGNGN